MSTLQTYRSGSFSGPCWPNPSNPDTTTWTYAAWFDQPLAKTYADATSVTYSYRPSGALEKRTWARGTFTTYSYDTFGRLLSVNYSDSTPDVTYTYYTASGRPLTRTDAAGTTTFTHTNDGQTEAESTTGSGLLTGAGVDPAYDAFGRRSQLTVTHPAMTAQSISYTYSGERLATVTSGTRNVIVGYATGTNSIGSLTFRENSTNVMIGTRTFHSSGQQAYIGYTGYGYGSPTLLQSFSYQYDRDRVTAVTRQDYSQWVYQYDSAGQGGKAGRKKSYSGAELLNGSGAQFAYDLAGNRTSAKRSGAGNWPTITGTLDTTYSATNALNQYTSISNPTSHDVTGASSAQNIAVTANGASQSVAYQPITGGYHFSSRVANTGGDRYEHITVSQSGVTLEDGDQYFPTPFQTVASLKFDLDGNTTFDCGQGSGGLEGRWMYVWDCENRLIRMESAYSATPTPGVPGLRLTFTYDGLSRRIGKLVESKGSSGSWTTVYEDRYIYDGWHHVATLRSIAGSGTFARAATYIWGPDIGSTGYAREDWQRAGGVGGLLMVLDGISVGAGDPADDDYFPLMDRLGNITGYRKAKSAQASSSLDAIYDYDAFGQELRSSGPAADRVPYHFSTKFTDIESGLNYYGYRFYDPGKGRWLNRDPIEELGGLNLYAFARNGSTIHIDKDGRLLPLLVPAVAGGGGTVAAGTGTAGVGTFLAYATAAIASIWGGKEIADHLNARRTDPDEESDKEKKKKGDNKRHNDKAQDAYREAARRFAAKGKPFDRIAKRRLLHDIVHNLNTNDFEKMVEEIMEVLCPDLPCPHKPK